MSLNISPKNMGNIGQLSTNIKLLMKLHNIKERDISGITGIPASTINNLINSYHVDPRISTLIPIANFFKVTIGQLFGSEAININESKNINYKSIPIIDLDQVINYVGNNINKDNISSWTIDYQRDSDSFGIECPKSYEIFFKQNALLIVEQKTTLEDGDIVILTSDHSSIKIRLVIKDGDEIILKSIINSELEPFNNQYTIIGEISEVRYKL
jgi:transcriptional regulator with XRE-family HTH domain